MYSLDETHYSSLKRGEKENEKQDYIGIALCCVRKDRAKDKRVKTVRQRTVPCLYILFVNGYVNYVGPERGCGNGFYSHYHPTRNHTGYNSIHIWYYD